MSWLQVFVNFLVHCIAFSDDFPQHGKAWKSMESMRTSLCLQIGCIQRIKANDLILNLTPENMIQRSRIE